MDQDMMKRLTLKASKQITAASSKGYVKIEKQGQETIIYIYYPIGLEGAFDKIKNTEERYYYELHDAIEDKILGLISKFSNGVLYTIDEIVGDIQWNQKDSKISFYTKKKDDLLIKKIQNEKAIGGVIKGVFDPEEPSLKKTLDKYTRI